MSVARAVLVLTLLSGCWSVEDESALFQVRARRHGEEDHDDCACLPWADVYGFGKDKSECGLAYELPFHSADGSPIPGPLLAQFPAVAERYCLKIFSKLPRENFCLQKEHNRSTTSWCYVSDKCEQGTRPSPMESAHKSLRVKECGDGDDQLRKHNFQDVFTLFRKAGFPEIGVAMKYAFPTIDGVKTQAAQDYFEGAGVEEEVEKIIEAAMASGETLRFLPEQDDISPFAVLEGKRFYMFSAEWKCLTGCADGAKSSTEIVMKEREKMNKLIRKIEEKREAEESVPGWVDPAEAGRSDTQDKDDGVDCYNVTGWDLHEIPKCAKLLNKQGELPPREAGKTPAALPPSSGSEARKEKVAKEAKVAKEKNIIKEKGQRKEDQVRRKKEDKKDKKEDEPRPKALPPSREGKERREKETKEKNIQKKSKDKEDQVRTKKKGSKKSKAEKEKKNKKED